MGHADTSSSGVGSVELRIPPSAEHLALVRLALTGVAAVGEASEELVTDLKLAVTEACTNAIQHAYPDGAGEGSQVIVRIMLEPNGITIEVEDHGVGFDATGGVDTSESRSPEGGMGLWIISALIQDLEIESGAAGSRIAMSRALRETP
jgi:serine/threonine-protein kinase RsbW